MYYGVWVEGRLEGWHTSGYIYKTGNKVEAREVYKSAVEHAESKEYEWVRLIKVDAQDETVLDEWERFVYDDDRSFGFIGG